MNTAMKCMKIAKGPTDALGFMNVIFITWLSLTFFVHLCGLCQGDEKKNTNAIIMRRNQTTVNNF